MDRAKIGVVGLGTFGAKHARVLAQLPQVELVAVCSRSADRAKEVAAECDARNALRVGLAIVESAEKGKAVRL